MSLTKESKIRVLENFYALDYVFFGKPIQEVSVCCPAFVVEYVSVKGALLSTLIEMYNLIEHSPKEISGKVSKKSLIESSIRSAKIARKNSKTLVTSEKGIKDVKKLVNEALAKVSKNKKANVDKITESKIREKAFSLAVDNMLVAKALKESSDVNSLDEWDGRIIEDAYKVLRESLVESAIDILNNIVEK